jgi:peptidoglycan/xylan/chitin deacetylase (PgdA/CDA1 family)
MCGDGTVAPVEPVATTIAVQLTSADLTAIGAETFATAVVLDQGGAPMAGVSIQWSSDDPAVAAVSSAGVVTAVGNGATTIRAGTGPIEGSTPVAVAQRVEFLLLLQADSLVLDDPGDSIRISFDARDELGTSVPDAGALWASSDTTVATVDTDGTVRATGTGTATVTASVGGAADSVLVRVAPELTLASVGELPLSVEVDAEVALSARVEEVLGGPYAGASVQWSVGAGSGTIASASEGTSDVTGISGAVWRLGETSGTQRAFASIETRGRTEIVEFLADVSPGSSVSATLVADTVLLSARGETAFLAPAHADRFGNPTTPGAVTWTSSNPSVATVSVDGLVTGVTEGSTWIVADVAGPTDSLEVTVAMRGAVTITFDDGWLSVYENAWSVLQEFGFAANIAVNPGPVDGGFPAYMTEAMLDELHADGWSMVSHTLNHDSLTTLTAAELDYDLRSSQQWLRDRGYRGWNVFVAPYHAYGAAEREAVSRYYTASRGVSSDSFTPDSLVAWQPANPFLLTGREAEFAPYTTPEGRQELLALVQRTVDEGAFLDVFFHQLPASGVDSLRELLGMLQAIPEIRDRVLPYHELYPVFARSVF